MDIKLFRRRKDFIASGCFGQFIGDAGKILWQTLEHAYPILPDGSLDVSDDPVITSDTKFGTKIQDGAYTMVLHESPHLGYTVWKLTGNGADPHNFLIHILNYNKESEGCVGIGEQIGHMENGGLMLQESKGAFKNLMALQNGLAKWMLTVETVD